MKYKLLCIFIFVCLLFTACKPIKGEKTIEEVKYELLRLKAYTCDVTMWVTNNISTAEYQMKHLYKAPDRYRIEVVKPDVLLGQTTIFNGSSSYVYHPGIDAYLKMDGFEGSPEHASFVGAFIEYFKQVEKAKVYKEKLDNRSFYVLELKLSDENRYMSTEKLWIDAEKAIPFKLEIYDKSGEVRVRVLYDNFVRNMKLEDSLFEIS